MICDCEPAISLPKPELDGVLLACQDASTAIAEFFPGFARLSQVLACLLGTLTAVKNMGRGCRGFGVFYAAIFLRPIFATFALL